MNNNSIIAERVANAMQLVWQQHGIESDIFISQINPVGAQKF